MIGIICALKIEVDGLKALMENAQTTEKAGLAFISGKIFDKDVVLLECGVGKVNAAVGTQIMIDLFKPEVVINSGIAGSLTKHLTVGDIVISSDCVEHDINCTALEEPRGQIWFTDEKRIGIPADKEVVEKLAESLHQRRLQVQQGGELRGVQGARRRQSHQGDQEIYQTDLKKVPLWQHESELP